MSDCTPEWSTGQPNNSPHADGETVFSRSFGRMTDTADVVVCGGGIAGLATAYHLSVRHRAGRVIIVDELPPMSLTSDKGTQGYRNWWPGPDDTMFRFVSRSIDLLEETAHESGNVLRLNRRGYLFATANEAELGPPRGYRAEGFRIRHGRRARPPVGRDVCARAGRRIWRSADRRGSAARRRGAHGVSLFCRETWRARSTCDAPVFMSGVNLGAWFLAQASANGATFMRDRVASVRTDGGRVAEIGLASGARIATERLVIAAGPGLPRVAAMLGVTLPVFHELHAKVTFRDRRRAVQRDAPFLIWNDPLHIDWSPAPNGATSVSNKTSRAAFTSAPWISRTAMSFISFGHSKRTGATTSGRRLSIVATPRSCSAAVRKWSGDGAIRRRRATRHHRRRILLQDAGESPSRRAVAGRGRIRDRRALRLRTHVRARAPVSSLAAHVVERTLPDYARWFLPSRYDDPAYRRLVEEWGPLVGQL